jgi:hypothetical protein
LLRTVLSRRYEVQPRRNCKTSLITPEAIRRIHELRVKGKGPIEIGRLLEIPRKAVARVLAEEKGDTA